MNTPTPLSSDQCKIWWNIANVGGGLAYDEQLNANVFLLLFTQKFCQLLSWIDVVDGEIL